MIHLEVILQPSLVDNVKNLNKIVESFLIVLCLFSKTLYIHSHASL